MTVEATPLVVNKVISVMSPPLESFALGFSPGKVPRTLDSGAGDDRSARLNWLRVL